MEDLFYKSNTKFDSLKADIKEIEINTVREAAGIKKNITALADEMNRRFDAIEITLEADQSDLKQILISLGIVKSSDVFYAAIIKDAVWVFLDARLHNAFVAQGKHAEEINWFLSAYKVMPWRNDLHWCDCGGVDRLRVVRSVCGLPTARSCASRAVGNIVYRP